MKKVALFLTLVMVLTVAAPALASNPFTDVPLGHWAYDAISKVAELGIMQGTPEGEFNGEKAMSRYEMAITTAKIADMVEENGAQLSEGEKKEVEQMVNKLQEEFSKELKMIKEDVEQNKKDVKALKGKADTNRKIGIAAIVLSLLAAAK